jgi:(p)ppGpp synthase/HD superfamily hydrolase
VNCVNGKLVPLNYEKMGDQVEIITSQNQNLPLTGLITLPHPEQKIKSERIK